MQRILFLCLIWAVACSPVTLTANFDRQADFSAYETFFLPPRQLNPVPRYPEYDNPAVRRLIRQAIEREMTALGFSSNPQQPNLLVQYDIVIIEHIDPRVDSAVIYKPWVDTRIDSFNYTEGLLVIRLIDRQQGRLIWQGSLSGILNRKPRRFEHKVEQYIGRLFGSLATRMKEKTDRVPH